MNSTGQPYPVPVAPHRRLLESGRGVQDQPETAGEGGIEERVRFHDLRHTFATMGHYSAGFTLDTSLHITNDMQRGAAEKIGGFMETATAKPEPEPPDPPEESRCKVIPFERVG